MLPSPCSTATFLSAVGKGRASAAVRCSPPTPRWVNPVYNVCVFPVWVPLRPPVGCFVGPSLWWSAFVWPLCVGRAAAVCWPLSVLHSVCDIHSLHVAHRLRCRCALAHGTYLVGPRTLRAWSPRRRGSRSPRSHGSRSRSPSSSCAELGSSGSRLGSCTPRPTRRSVEPRQAPLRALTTTPRALPSSHPASCPLLILPPPRTSRRSSPGHLRPSTCPCTRTTSTTTTPAA